MMSIGRGLTYLMATGVQGTVASNIPMRDPAVNFIGDGYLGPVPFPIIEMLVLVGVFTWFLRNTVLGRQIYAVGSNEEAARLSGVNVNRVKLFTYTATGVLCALAGIMSGGLLATAATNAGEGNELDVIAAVVIGGASLSGGVGTIIGAIIRRGHHGGPSQRLCSSPSAGVPADGVHWGGDHPGRGLGQPAAASRPASGYPRRTARSYGVQSRTLSGFEKSFVRRRQSMSMTRKAVDPRLRADPCRAGCVGGRGPGEKAIAAGTCFRQRDNGNR